MSLDESEAEYLSADEAARVLYLPARTVRRWAAHGRIPGVITVGGQVQLPRTAIQAILDQRGGNG